MSSNYTSKTLLKNLFSITSGQVINLTFTFLSITVAARHLGVESFGKFGYLLAIVVIVSKAMDFGFTPIVFRELSIKKYDYTLLNTALALRFIAFVFVALVFNAFVFFLNFTATEIILSDILLINALISSKFICVRELMDVPFKVNFKMHYPMIFTNIDNLILMISVFFIPLFKDRLTFFIIMYAISNIPGMILMLIYLKKKFNFTITPTLKSAKWLFRESLPIFGFILLDTLYQQMDVILLKNFDNYYAAGVYAAASRLVMPLLIFPTAIIHTIFPLVSKNANDNDKNNDILINLVFKILFLFAAILAYIFIFKNQSFILIIYGKKYIDSSLPTAILLFSQIFFFYNFFIVNLLIAYRKQKYDFIYSALILVVHFIASVILIPKYSYNGVAFSKVIVGAVGFVFTSFILYKTVNKFYLISKTFIFWNFLVLLAFYLLSYLPLIVYGILALVTVLIITLILQFFEKHEILFLFERFNKKELGNKIINLKIFNLVR